MFNSTRIGGLANCERASATLHLNGWGFAPPGDTQADWLMQQFLRAPGAALHLNSVCREMRTAFPRGTDPDATVERMLAHGLSNVSLVWHRDTDGTRVYVGAEPCAIPLPRGQDPLLRGFLFDDWYRNSRPTEPVPAGVA